MGASCFKGGPVDEDGNPKQGDQSGGPGRTGIGALNGHSHAGASGRGLETNAGDRFKKFTLEELLLATDKFSEQAIVSEGGRQAVNVVYRGRLKTPMRGGTVTEVAVKRFSKREWEDLKAFAAEVQRISVVEHPNITSLVGYCSEGDDRLLVSEYMSHSTLAQHLFHWEQHPMAWPPRLNLAVKVAQALQYLSTGAGVNAYHDLNPYRILFNQASEPKLSCFGLMKPSKDGRFSSNLSSAPPELYTSGAVTENTVVYMLGSLLMSLFSGKQMRPMQFVERVTSACDMTTLVDSNLMGKPGVDQALELVPLIVDCLNSNPEKRPHVQQATDFLTMLQSGEVVSASEVEGSEIAPRSKMSFQDAARKGDWDQLHRLLATNQLGSHIEPNFGLWNSQHLQDAVRSRQRGKIAFQKQDWETAINEISEYASSEAPKAPGLLLRRAYAHMKLGHWEQALEDIEQAKSHQQGNWVEALSLEALALREQGKEESAEAVFASLEQKQIVL